MRTHEEDFELFLSMISAGLLLVFLIVVAYLMFWITSKP